MILTEPKYNKNGQIVVCQQIEIKCDTCGKVWSPCDLRAILKRGLEKEHLCYGCLYRARPPKTMSVEAKEKISKANKGKTWEVRRTPEQILQMKEKASKRISDYNRGTKGLSLEERLGNEGAASVRQQRSVNATGEKNSMFGKPAPLGSGLGIQGWYKGWFFRSLKELSFVINHLEANDIQWVSGECLEYRIPYLLDGVKRNYYPDFIIGKEVAEIKPIIWTQKSDIVKAKAEYAEIWCKERGLTYKIYSEKDYGQLSRNELKSLVERNVVTLKKGIIIKGE